MAGEEQQVARADGRDVVRHRRVRRGQRDVFRLQIRFGAHQNDPPLLTAGRSCHTRRVPVKPVTPIPAATLVLLRETAPGVEVLLTQRHSANKFAGGDFVFPGGKIEVDDNPDDAVAWCVGLDPARAAARIGATDTRTAVGYWVGAIRETFEEIGVLLAYDAAGQPARIDAPRFADY